MRSYLLWAPLAVAELCSATLTLPVHKNHRRHQAALRRRAIKKRDNSFDVTLYSDIVDGGGGFYYVNASVGSPVQYVALDIDTGSADVWMFGPDSCDPSTSACLGGAYDPNSSNTSGNFSDSGAFQIQYFTQGSGVTGIYFTDDFTIGGQTVSQLEMGLAEQAESVTTGIMGIGFDLNEAAVAGGNKAAYNNLIDELKLQGIIETKAYSLYLDDIESETGLITFGGYDTGKFQGDLAILDIQPSVDSGTYKDFAVVLSSVGVTDTSGSTVLTTSNLPNTAVLDSGTAFTILPHDLFSELANYFGADNDQQLGWIVYCDMGGMSGTLDYQFGSNTGPLISVPFEELAVPVYDTNGNQITDKNGKAICQLGLDEQSSSDEPLLFGDTFLRSAYVVYDLDNLQVGIAQTIFNSTSSDVKVITANSKSDNLPGSIVSAATTIKETATGKEVGAETASQVSGGSQATAVATGAGASALNGVKTTYANRASSIPGGTPSKGDAPSYRASPAGKWVTVAAQAGGMLAALSVGAMLVL